ncbi:MAG: hypothetical protein PHS14_16405 [Elusimicrobia bacterium]|nr:hypothetical protein [Elusimicrobiota bacterium]
MSGDHKASLPTYALRIKALANQGSIKGRRRGWWKRLRMWIAGEAA